ncbi:hypothetical protein RJT34_14926 [Clitoria ternatea]|uniref:Epidermal patterning factor-like protein n=1 Tax=Clitoria ternatea TaxID=43366 RepID=A0AAN9JTE4_CLITE
MFCHLAAAVFKHFATVAEPTIRTQDVSRHGFDPTQQENKEALKGSTRLGSTPPRCEHKCGGCIPCYPIQIPTNSDLLGVHYANYEPEGWKCKCGNSYFNR